MRKAHSGLTEKAAKMPSSMAIPRRILLQIRRPSTNRPTSNQIPHQPSSSNFPTTNSPTKLRFPLNLTSLPHFRLFGQQKSAQQICWQCGQKLGDGTTNFDDIQCPHCQRLQPIPTSADYFSYLGIEPKYRLDLSELKQRFRRKQARVHPDKFAQSSAEEKRHSEEHSTFLNSAYRTLRDPFSRGDYMLELFEKQQTISHAMEQTETDLELAEQMMELNEFIEEMEDQGQIKQKMAELDAEIECLLAQLNEELARREVVAGMRTMRRISYFRRSRRLLEGSSEAPDGL